MRSLQRAMRFGGVQRNKCSHRASQRLIGVGAFVVCVFLCFFVLFVVFLCVCVCFGVFLCCFVF